MKSYRIKHRSRRYTNSRPFLFMQLRPWKYEWKTCLCLSKLANTYFELKINLYRFFREFSLALSVSLVCLLSSTYVLWSSNEVERFQCFAEERCCQLTGKCGSLSRGELPRSPAIRWRIIVHSRAALTYGLVKWIKINYRSTVSVWEYLQVNRAKLSRWDNLLNGWVELAVKYRFYWKA